MSVKLRQLIDIVRADPAVDTVVGFTGVGSGGGFSQINTGTVFVWLKPISQRATVDEVIARLRPKLAQVPGGRLYLAAVQDLRAGGRQSNAQYQYTLQSENVQDLYAWTPKLVDALEHNPVLTDVSSDQQQRGLETYINIDRDTTARLGVESVANRQYALRRIRATAGVGHLQRDQSVSCGDGDRSALHAVSELAPRCLCLSVRRDASRNRDDQRTGGQRHGVNDGRNGRPFASGTGLARCHSLPALSLARFPGIRHERQDLKHHNRSKRNYRSKRQRRGRTPTPS